MTISIENEFLKAEVKIKGAELCGLTEKLTRDKLYMERRPGILGEVFACTFPIVGALKNNTFTMAISPISWGDTDLQGIWILRWKSLIMR